MIVSIESRLSGRRLLLVEDNPGDADLVREHLLDAGDDVPYLDVVETLAEAAERLRDEDYVAVVLDLDLPDSSGLDTLDRALPLAAAAPVIVLTGGGSAELGIRAVRRGAADFLPKDEITGRLLLRSVRYALERGQRRAAEARSRALIENSRDLVSVLDRDLSILYVSPSIHRILGFRPEEKVGSDAGLEVHPEDRDRVRGAVQHLLEHPDHTARLEYRVRHKDGGWRLLDTVAQDCFDEPHIRGFVVNSRDVTELREAEKAAASTTRRLERTLGAVQDAVLTVDPVERTVLDCNPATESIFGHAPADLIGRSTRVLHVDERSYHEFKERLVRALEAGEHFRDEYRMRRRDGTIFPANVTVSLLDPEKGIEGGVVGVFHDLTDRVERESQVRFQAGLLRQVGQPVLAVDQDGLVTYWNEAAESLTGLAVEEVMGRPILDILVHEADRETALAAREIVQGGGRWEGELRLRKKDGGIAIVQATATPGINPDGTPGGRIATGVDITELRQAEEESRRVAERARFQADMLEAVGQAVIATDLDGRIIYWNRAAEELYGWSREEALGEPILDVTPSDATRDTAAEIFETLRAGESWTGEFDVQRRDGSTFHAMITDSPLLDEEGNLVGIIGVSSDISESKQLEEQLRQAQKMEAVGRLAGGVAHDFNNLLTAVEGHAALLLEELPDDSPLREDAKEVLAAGRRAAALTRQLLAFSRRQVLEERRVDLRQVAGDLESMLRRLVPERIEFRVEPGVEETVVRADPNQLQQVIMNLVLNAVDAIQVGGEIVVGIDATRLSPEEAAAMPWTVEPGPYARLEVRDDGVGMEPELVDHIFEPFYTTKPEGEGTGLGLSTVYGIVKQSGGHILVESEPGEGATFRVLLPRLAERPDRAPERPERKPRAAEGVILLVEDDQAVRNIARRILERAGYTVLEASNGREALEVAGSANGRLDLVISDVVMPDLGGVELQKRLSERHPDLEIVLTSGYSEAEVRGEVRQLGAAFLAKPFTPAALLRCVAEALDR